MTQPRASSALRQPARAGASFVSCVLPRPALPLLWKRCPQQPWQSESGVLGSVGHGTAAAPRNRWGVSPAEGPEPPAASGGMLRGRAGMGIWQECAKARVAIQERRKCQEHIVCGPGAGYVFVFIDQAVLQPGQGAGATPGSAPEPEA